VILPIGASIPLVPAGNFGFYAGSDFLPDPGTNGPLLMAGDLYVNIHTALNPGGEIRGQLIFDQFVVIPVPAAAVLLLSGLGVLGARATRSPRAA
jgi:hypothetical protein